MATSRAFAYNSSPTPPAGAIQYGNIAVQSTGWLSGAGGLKWWNGPSEDSRYIISRTSGPKTAANGTEEILTNTVGFLGSTAKTDESFLALVNSQFGQSHVTASVAKTWLNENGYWTSYEPPRPYLLLEDIATYLRDYMSDFRNPSFYNYRLDGNGQYISDGGGDMYDAGNFTTPWLLSGTQYTSNASGINSFPFAINYTNNTSTLIDTDFYYLSLGYTQYTGGAQDATYLPLTVLGSRSSTGPIGWQAGGNSGADGGGTLASGEILTASQSNGFTTYAYYRQTYNAGDPSHCNLIILLGHPTWESNFGTINSFADPTGNGSNGVYYYTANATNILAIHTLLSKNSGVQVTAEECRNVVANFTLRIKQALNY